MNKSSKFSIKLANIFSNEKKNSTTSQASSASAELEASQEKARKETFKLTKTSRIGFPHKPTCMAYDVMQHILAIGTKHGYVKLYGGPSIEYTLYHSSSIGNSTNSNSTASMAATSANLMQTQSSGFSTAVLFMNFVCNEGVLITYCDDGTISLWNLRQKQPGILFSKKLINEKATAMHLPFKSSWLYIGTEKGNTYLLNIYNNFSQSGYDIKWNNVIELSQKTKPGKVVHLSDHPNDSSKILIGFDSGLIVLWNLKLKRGELRFYGTAEMMSSISWFYDGKQFMSSHNNGSLIVWNCKNDTKPANILHPHMNETDLIPKYNMVKKCYWEANKNGDQFIIFSDGLPSTDCSIRDAITIIKNNKFKTVIEMKERIVDFLLVYNSPWQNENPSDPSAVIVLLERSLVAIDLKTDGFPQFRHHHAITIHESPVTVCNYIVEPSRALVQSFTDLKEKSIQSQNSFQQNSQTIGNATVSNTFFSSLPYPVNGGIKCSKSNIFPYGEMIITGHEDGCIKFWESSGLDLVQIHKFKTQRLFDKRRAQDSSTSTSINEIEFPHKITAIDLVGNYLGVAAAGGHVTLYKYYQKITSLADEELAEIPLCEILINYDYNNNESRSQPDTTQLNKDYKTYFRTKIGFRRQQGFQPELVCLLFWSQKAPVVNNVKIYPKHEMLLFGTDESIVCLDSLNRTILLNISLVDLYANQDPFHRHQKSPKKTNKSSTNEAEEGGGAGELHGFAHHLSKQLTIDATSFLHTQKETLSRNSSYTSMENLASNEGVTCISMNNFSPIMLNNSKSEFQQQTVQIWIGTTYGSVIVLNSTMYSSDTKAPTSVTSSNNGSATNNQNIKPATLITPSGVVHSLKGQIVDIAFLDINGNLLNPNQMERKFKENKDAQDGLDNDEDIDYSFLMNNSMSNSIADNFYGVQTSSSNVTTAAVPTTTTTTATIANNNSNNNSSHQLVNNASGVSLSESYLSSSPHTSNALTEEPKISHKTSKKGLAATKSSKNESCSMQDEKTQFAVLTSEYQIKVIGLPSQQCIHKHTISEGTISKSSVVVINGLSYLSCYLTNGSILVFNLPNPTLKSNLNLNIKEKEQLASKTFTFGSKGHSFYMCSPSEIQKLYLSSNNTAYNLTDMLSEFFDPKIVSPPPPKPNIIKSLFSVTPLDREELFGESSGKPSTCIVKGVDGEVQRTKKELSDLQKLALERGEKLNALQMKTEEMSQAASAFAKNAHELANKYKNKRLF